MSDEYRRQIGSWTRALAVARHEPLERHLARDGQGGQVELFTLANLEKRFDKIVGQLELLRDGFDDLDELVAAYVRRIPPAAYDLGCQDAEQFLQWLADTTKLSDVQRDYVACQRSRHAIETLARGNHQGHVRFQELAGRVEQTLGEWDECRQLRIWLNPIHVWAVFETAELVGDEAAPPAEVLFYADGSEIRTALLEAWGNDLVRGLEQLGPCTLADWSTHCGWAPDELAEFARDLAELGIVALGE
jgi:hypothetical protein